MPYQRKRKRVTRSEFEDLQVQVSSVTAAIYNFGHVLKAFIVDGKKPRFDDEVLAAQSASYSTQVAASAAHTATFLGDQTTFALFLKTLFKEYSSKNSLISLSQHVLILPILS